MPFRRPQNTGFFFAAHLLRRLALAVWFAGCSGAWALDAVTLQLKWAHGFQFAGYYAAQAQGYYRDAGLDVHIVPAQPGDDPIRPVLDGQAQYGVGNSNLLLTRQAGHPVVVMAVIFQHSPLVLVARRSDTLQDIHSLRYKRVMFEPHAEELRAYLRQEGVDTTTLDERPHSFDINDLIEGRVDAMTAYLTYELYDLEKAQVPYQIFTSRSVGIDFYGDNLFTTETELRQHPQRVAAMRAASLKGWKYAMEHPQEITDLILSRYSRQRTREFHLFEAQRMVPLLQPGLVELGYMNPGRWQHIAQTFTTLGLLPASFSLAGFLYDPLSPAPGPNRDLLLALGLLLGALALAAYIFHVNRRLAGSLRRLRDTQASLQDSEALLRTLSDTAAAGIYVLQGEHLVMVNEFLITLTGYPRERLLTMRFTELIHPGDRELVAQRARARLRGEPVINRYAFKLLTQSGETRWVELTVGPIQFQGQSASLGTVYDITERITAQEALHASQRMYRTLTENMKDVVWTLDAQTRRFLYVSPSVQALYGYTAEEVMAGTLEDTLLPASVPRIHEWIAQHTAELLDGTLPPRTYFTTELEQPCKDGTVVWTEVISHYSLNPDTGHTEIHGVTRDVSERRATQERLRHMAQHDALTGLANRALFDDRLQNALSSTRRELQRLALLYLDLDRFKPVNDRFGHAVGDVLLQQVAARIQHCLRESDTVARVGGDEFVVLLRRINGPDDALHVARKIHQTLRQPYELPDHTLEISCSIGVAIHPEHGLDDITLSHHADTAMYEAKSHGRDQVQLYRAQE